MNELRQATLNFEQHRISKEFEDAHGHRQRGLQGNPSP
jgi:hypothetical protein